MKIFLVFSKSNYMKTENRPLKAFLNKEDAEYFVKVGQNIFYKFERYRIMCDRLESLNSKIWKDNNFIKTKISNYWNYDQGVFRDIYHEEIKLLFNDEELRYHYRHCNENNLVHIPCYDCYEIVEMDVE